MAEIRRIAVEGARPAGIRDGVLEAIAAIEGVTDVLALPDVHQKARADVPSPVVENGAGNRIGIISFGTSYEPTREARDRLVAQGTESNHMLVRALPLTDEVEQFLAANEAVYVVEQNRDGQMTQIMRDDFPRYAARVRPVLIFDGLPPAPGEIVEQILEAQKAS